MTQKNLYLVKWQNHANDYNPWEPENLTAILMSLDVLKYKIVNGTRMKWEISDGISVTEWLP